MLGPFKLGDWCVNPATGEVSRGAERLQLEPRVMGVLVCLAERHDRVVSKEELLRVVWCDTAVTDHVLWRCVSQLRKAFGDDRRCPVFFETLPKRGYRLRAPLSAATAKVEHDGSGGSALTGAGPARIGSDRESSDSPGHSSLSRSSTPDRRRTARRTARARPRDVAVGTPLPRVVGSIFRDARSAQRLSQEQVAALTEGRPVSVSRTMISAIERGSSLPGLEALVSLSRALSIEPAEILERIDLAMSPGVDVAGRMIEELHREGLERYRAGEFREALAFFDAALERLAGEPTADEEETRRRRARLEINRATALRRSMAPNAAQAAAERSVGLAAGVPGLQAEAYIVYASVLSQAGHHVLARDAAERAVRLAEDAGARPLGLAWMQYGTVCGRAGDYEEARGAFLRARRLTDAARDRHSRIKLEGNIGVCLMMLGRPKQARSRLSKAIELARRLGDRSAEALWTAELGRVALDEERLDEAERCGHTALAIARPAGQLVTVFSAEWLMHRVVRRRNAHAPDRRRLARLERLWMRLRGHRGHATIHEFEQAVIDPAERREDLPDET